MPSLRLVRLFRRMISGFSSPIKSLLLFNIRICLDYLALSEFIHCHTKPRRWFLAYAKQYAFQTLFMLSTKNSRKLIWLPNMSHSYWVVYIYWIRKMYLPNYPRSRPKLVKRLSIHNQISVLIQQIIGQLNCLPTTYYDIVCMARK